MFVTREAFEAVGGFDEGLYASEEIGLARALRRAGRFRVVPQPIVTSGRKVRRYSAPSLLWMALRICLQGTMMVTASRKDLQLRVIRRVKILMPYRTDILSI